MHVLLRSMGKINHASAMNIFLSSIFYFFNTISPEVNCLKDFHFFSPTPVIFNYFSFFRFIIGLGSIRLFVCS